MFTLPNMVSLANLACGCLAAFAALRGDLHSAFWLVAAAAACDFLDGLAARLTGQYSEIGKQLDSLCDVVSFGVAPAAVLWAMGGGGWPVFLVLFSALRLAKFNVDTSQKDSFVGLPTPASALLVCSLGASRTLEPWMAIALTGILCVLLVCRLRMFSLKFTGFGWRGNGLRYCFLTGAAAAVALLGVGGVAVCVAGYVAISLLLPKKESE